MKLTIAGAALFASALLSTPLSASLIYDSSLVLSGQGLGAVSTIMTMQGNGQSRPGELETGCAKWNGAATVGGATACSALGNGFSITGADTKTGAGQIGSPTLGSVGITNAGSIVIVFNASEPAGDSIQLEQLILNLFRADGTLYFSASLANAFRPTLFPNSATGVGNAGFSFRLDGAQSSQAQALGILSTDRVGVEASATAWGGGVETFSLGNSPVPEPATYATLGFGIAVLALLRRRR